MRNSIITLMLPAAMIAVAAPAAAQTSTSGTVGLTLTVTNACTVNGATAVTTNAGSLGSIAFPNQPGVFGNVDGELVGSMGALSVLCSPGVSPVLTIGSGANDASGTRNLRANGRNIAYRLFSDSQRSSELTIGAQMALAAATGSPQSVPIYARVNSGGVAIPAGTYTDTVTVTLSW